MDPWVQVISQVGFPIGVAIYLLTSFSGQIRSLTASNHALVDAVKALQVALGNCNNCPLHGTKEMRIGQAVIDRIGTKEQE